MCIAFFSFQNSIHSHIQGPYRALKIKCNTHPNSGAEVHKLFPFFYLLVWFESLIGQARGMTLATWVTPYIRLNLRPKLKRKRYQTTTPTHVSNLTIF